MGSSQLSMYCIDDDADDDDDDDDGPVFSHDNV